MTRLRWLFLGVLVCLVACIPTTPVVVTSSPIATHTPVRLVADTLVLPTTARLTAPPAPSPTDPPMNNDPTYYYGGLTITLDEVGQTIPLQERQPFLIRLGPDYAWDIQVQPPQLATQNVHITPSPGDQGVFIARQKGQGDLVALGRPLCRDAQPPCAYPDIRFQVKLLVE